MSPKKRQKSKHANPAEKLSRALSWALRHQGPQVGLSMTPDGYVPVAQILSSNHPKLKGPWTLEDIERLVKNNDKQRFRLELRPAKNYTNYVKENNEQNDEILCIRATQGHSLQFIDQDLLLKPIPKEELVRMPTVVHGTYQEPWQKSICRQGLKRMSRNHIHFASGLPHKKGEVISGMRRTCDVYIYIDTERCANNPAISFYQSDNGVILTTGVNDTGILPVEYFSHVTDSEGNILLDQRVSSSSNNEEAS